jgi:GT2 family glycosyltransferase
VAEVRPSASVIVPNYNGALFLRECLESLLRQAFADFEVIVVDDASPDGSAEIVAGEFPTMRLIRLERNGGFAHAVNVGIAAARGEYVALLNNDAVADPGWLGALVETLRSHPEAGSAASKILLADGGNTLLSAGDIYRRAGVPDSRGVWEHDDGQYDDETEVFGACGAGCAYRRTMLDEIGGFDERFYMYCEDVDLAFRAQVRGFRCTYTPRAIVRHRLSATGGGALASYQCGRNFVWLLAKDVPGIAWRRYAARFVLTQLALTIDALRHIREPAARARLRGQISGWVWAPRLALERRRAAAPRVSDRYLLGLLS